MPCILVLCAWTWWIMCYNMWSCWPDLELCAHPCADRIANYICMPFKIQRINPTTENIKLAHQFSWTYWLLNSRFYLSVASIWKAVCTFLLFTVSYSLFGLILLEVMHTLALITQNWLQPVRSGSMLGICGALVPVVILLMLFRVHIFLVFPVFTRHGMKQV